MFNPIRNDRQSSADQDPFVASSTSAIEAVTTVSALPAAYGRAAANDEAAAPVRPLARNPLWIIAIGMAGFFGTAALVMALI